MDNIPNPFFTTEIDPDKFKYALELYMATLSGKAPGPDVSKTSISIEDTDETYQLTNHPMNVASAAVNKELYSMGQTQEQVASCLNRINIFIKTINQTENELLSCYLRKSSAGGVDVHYALFYAAASAKVITDKEGYYQFDINDLVLKANDVIETQ